MSFPTTTLKHLEVSDIPENRFSAAMAPLPSSFLARVNQRLSHEKQAEVPRDGILLDERDTEMVDGLAMTDAHPYFQEIQVGVFGFMS